MIVIGVDPGSRVTGYSFITKQKNRFKLVEAGCIKTNPKDSIPVRLHHIYAELDKLIFKHKPYSAAIEEIFAGKSIKSALLLGQARGVALMTLGKHNLDVSAYHPNKIKKNVGGHGKAGKNEMIRVVSMLLGVTEPLQADAADATAIAMTHIMLANLPNLAKANPSSRPGLMQALQDQAAKENAQRTKKKPSIKHPQHPQHPQKWRRP
jgi:crossover junction endodeoxyribonuclease RuvC